MTTRDSLENDLSEMLGMFTVKSLYFVGLNFRGFRGFHQQRIYIPNE